MKFSGLIAAVFAASTTFAATVQAATLIDNSNTAYYNNSIGRALDGTNPYAGSFMFPRPGKRPASDFTVPSEPDLSSAQATLGNWLTDPLNPGGTWTRNPVSIRKHWRKNTETAIIYTLDAGLGGIANAMASISVNNGAYVWLNGKFLGGLTSPGKNRNMETLALELGPIDAGMNYLQVLREDHAGTRRYSINVSGDYIDQQALSPVPLPASGLLLFGAAGGLAMFRRKAA